MDTSAKSRSSAWLAAKTKNAQKKQRIVLERELRKTKMCKYFSQGKPCYAGDNCDFAHSKEEITTRPVLSKTQLCINYAEGRCTDKNCSFAHGEDELRMMDWRCQMADLEEAETPGAASREPLKEVVSRLPNNWTTKQKLAAAIARHTDSSKDAHSEGSAVLSGESTQTGESIETSSDGASDHLDFAKASLSGLERPEDDIEPVSKQERERRQSRLCKYYVQGYCHFGSRCHYAHSVKEMKSTPESLQKTQPCSSLDASTHKEAPHLLAQAEHQLRATKGAASKNEEQLNMKKKKKAADRKQPASAASSFDKAIPEISAPGIWTPGLIGCGYQHLEGARVSREQASMRAPFSTSQQPYAPFEMLNLVEPMKVPQTDNFLLGQDLDSMIRKMAQLPSMIHMASSDRVLKSDVAELRKSVSALSEQVSRLGQRVPTSAAEPVPAYMTAPAQIGYERRMDRGDRSVGYANQTPMMLPPPGLI